MPYTPASPSRAPVRPSARRVWAASAVKLPMYEGSPNRRRRQLLVSIASGVGMGSALSGCGGGRLGDDATLRAVNATVDVPSVDVHFNDWLFASAVPYGGGPSSYVHRKLWTLGGSYGHFEVRCTGRSPILLRDTKTLPDADAASLVVMGSVSTGLRLRIVDEDTARPGGGAVRLRMLHALPLVGALDVFVTRSTPTLVRQTPSFRLGSYAELSGYADLSDDARLRITPAGRSDLLLFDSNLIGLTANQVANLVVSPAPGAAGVAVTVLPQGMPAYLMVNAALAAQDPLTL